MTNTRSSISKLKSCVGLAVLLAWSASADVIYDNTFYDTTNRFRLGTLEVGDEIILEGSARYLTNFSFEFYGTNGIAGGGDFSGNVQARIRFYENTTPNPSGYLAPAETPFYDSGLFGVPTTDLDGRSRFEFVPGRDNIPAGGLFLPIVSNMTWSVQFFGMEGADDVGLDIYTPVFVGGNYPDYWLNTGTNWLLLRDDVNNTDIRFAARMEATVPEPSTVALLALGGLGFLYASRRNRKS